MLGSLLDQVRNAVSNHPDQPGNNFKSSGLMSTIEGLFGQHAQNTGQVLLSPPNSYGDPSDQRQPTRPARPDPRPGVSFPQRGLQSQTSKRPLFHPVFLHVRHAVGRTDAQPRDVCECRRRYARRVRCFHAV